ncbi:MAG: DUF488 domain-containing protein [Euryarchaeota archaeon]|nr:DUF488 domain-containing protein [Euryarchaeota archaeon]
MMNTRQKCLVYFLKQSGQCSKMKLSKVFFLMSKDKSLTKFKFYGFVPYKYGPYSFELFHDLEMLEREGIIETDDTNIKFINGTVDLQEDTMNMVDFFFDETKSMDDNDMVEFTYEKYPKYTIFSEIKKKMAYSRDEIGIITIGYEGLSIDEFMMKLIDEKIQVLVDVRNNPWSMKYGFTGKSLNILCGKMGVEYIGLPEVGIPSELRKTLETKEDYDALFRHYRKFISKKEKELDMLLGLGREKKIALMCFEKDPEMCHRTVLAEELGRREKGVVIV